MTKTVDYLVMDPEGNITILVLSPVEREEYQIVAHALLDANPAAEQVGYVVSDGGNGSGREYPLMEMSGLEFCGNATRSFAFYEAMLQEPPAEEIDVMVSGCDYPLHAWIDAKDPSGGTVRLQMPIPEEMEEISIPVTADLAAELQLPEDAKDHYITGQLVHMDGISHLIIRSIPAEVTGKCSRETMDCLFMHLRDSVYQITTRDLPAFGVMFADPKAGRMTPIVYVRDVDTTYFEGSCASGSNAAAYAMAVSDLATAGCCSYTLKQPAGTLNIDVTGEGGVVKDIQLYGHVGMSGKRQLLVED